MSVAQDYGRALYSKTPVPVRVDARPRLVDSERAIDELELMIAANQPSALTRGYIVVRRGLYSGRGADAGAARHAAQRAAHPPAGRRTRRGQGGQPRQIALSGGDEP
jgi:hypothetical protein